ncbi:MAG: 5-dehydro-2-deoxygluconokinase [Thaumarchaeota archaeon]|nr:5-dehydro-2-deoxygluconokinase [Nitrososphaerota archaeon]
MVALGRAGVDLYALDYGVPFSEVRRFAKYVGGTSANVVVGASRLGLKCALVTRLSADVLGDYVIGYLAAEGVETRYIKQEKEGKTGIVFAEVYPGKDSMFLFYRENVADIHLARGDIERDLIQKTRALIVTGTGISQQPSFGSTLHAAKLGRQLKKTVVFNLDWRPSLWQTAQSVRTSRYRKVFAESSIVIGNEGEYLAATGAADLMGAIESIPQHSKRVLVVTHGASGVTVIEGDSRTDVPGIPVPFVKGLGGGDGFLAGFMFGHLKGWEPAQAASLGNAVGAMVVTGHACSESMPRPRELNRFLREKGMSFDLGSPSKV